jgi:hypothetical protein
MEDYQFSLGNHRNELSSGTIDYKTTIWKAFDDYGVDMIFNGHDHLYERTDPINLNVSASLKVAKYGSGASEGRFQVVTGGAGAPLYTTTADATQMVNNSQSTLNYCKVTVTTDTMYFKAYDSNNLQIDTYTFIKAAPTDILSESVALTSVNVYPNPTDEVFNIQVTNIESYTYSVYNTFGQKLFSNKVSNAQQSHVTSVNLTGFPKGIYIVEIKTAHKVITKRVLLN